MTTGEIRKRFGFVATEKGYITTEQLIKAMKLQVREEIATRKPRLIGEILIELGYMDSSERDELLREMGVLEP
ncbi:MAG: hypothetical protein V1689_03670 [Pseudomonadota bacterium]